MVARTEAGSSTKEVVGVVSFYMVAAILMVTVNKWAMLSSSVPVFLLFCQLAVAAVLLMASHLAGLCSFPRWDWKTVRKLCPMIALNVLGLVFNNLCLHYVDASFYQVARGLVLPFAIAVAVVTNQGAPSPKAAVCCVWITIGFGIGVLLDQHSTVVRKGPSFIGIAFGILSSVTTAIHSITIKDSLPHVNHSALHLAWYANVLSSLAMIPTIVLAGEVPGVYALFLDDSQLRRFLWGCLVTGVVGFLICVAGVLSIKVTSPVTHMVSAAARGAIQTLLSVWLFRDIISRSRAASIIVITTGSIAYTWVKHREGNRPPSTRPRQPKEDETRLLEKEAEEV
ncbi:hypothetical protein EHS25_007282 [Saitozyma podzolica]|uniref:Sugar phosphate transporter domain-containing protein n=1 Tax=Saitozyma podzolica TaxID=1890683 RepID=A0A427XN92_9TREE|nr:hypothetical protein EHS25_007282 [Saitozyma podzolica]